MRVSCDRCGAKARISSSKELSPLVRKLYCACNNVDCGHTFTMDLTFGHTISPSAFDLAEDVREAIRQTGSRVDVMGILSGA